MTTTMMRLVGVKHVIRLNSIQILDNVGMIFLIRLNVFIERLTNNFKVELFYSKLSCFSTFFYRKSIFWWYFQSERLCETINGQESSRFILQTRKHRVRIRERNSKSSFRTFSYVFEDLSRCTIVYFVSFGWISNIYTSSEQCLNNSLLFRRKLSENISINLVIV